MLSQKSAGEKQSARRLGTTYEITQPPLISLTKLGGQNQDPNQIIRRLEKWSLQSVAREVLPGERVATCMRRLRDHAAGVTVMKGQKRAYYAGLQVCGSIWICPICAAKISEGRRVELQQGIARWRSSGYAVLHRVLTIPHNQGDRLKNMLDAFSRARGYLLNRKGHKRIGAVVGLVGTIRALEVTLGSNGWHVHTHELLFVKQKEIDIQKMEKDILTQWQTACIDAGLGRPNDHGVIIQDGSYADKYAAKWGLESEVTKAHTKAGRVGNQGPWDILRAIKDKPTSDNVGAYVEYAKCFKGRHQLHWSRGLKEMLGVVEKSDVEIAAEVSKEDRMLGILSKWEWSIILSKEKRGEVLAAAERGGWNGVVGYIRELCCDNEK